MEFNNLYYKKIVYKKNAFLDLKTLIKLNYNNKNICLISSKSVPTEEVAKVLNAMFCGSEKVSHFVVGKGFNNVEIEKFKTQLSTSRFKLLVAFGGGRICNAVKFFANKFNIPYII